MKKIFISHPFQNDPEENFKKVDMLLESLRKKHTDILFISPLHLFSYFESEVQKFREHIIEFCKHLLEECNEIWVYGKSAGCVKEAQYAEEIGVKVIWKCQ